MVTAQRKPKQLGQILLEQGLIDNEQLERALEEHRNTPKSLGRVLIDLGYIRERDLVRALAEQVGLEFVHLTEYRIAAAAVDQDVDLGDREAAIEEAPIVKLVQAIMTQAASDRASDVHIEPTEKDVRIRFRVDGGLHQVMHPPQH